MHRSCPLHFVFSPPLLNAHLDQAFPPHSCKRGPHPTHETQLCFLHIKGLHELGFYEKTPNYTGFAAKAHNTAVTYLLFSLFSLSLLNTSKYSKFGMSHNSLSLPLQSSWHVWGPGLRESSPLVFTTYTNFQNFWGRFVPNTRAPQSSQPSTPSLLSCQLGTARTGMGGAENTSPLPTSHSWLPTTVCAKRRPLQALAGDKNPVVLSVVAGTMAACHCSFGLSQTGGNITLFRNRHQDGLEASPDQDLAWKGCSLPQPVSSI